MKILVLFLSSLLSVLVFWGPDFAWAEWKLYDESEYLFFYYDSKSVRHIDNDTVRVWGKCTPNGKKGRKWLAEKSRIGIVTTKEVENISYATFQIELKCLNKMIRELAYNYFDDKLTILSPFDAFSSDWKFIIPGSTGYRLHKKVCTQK